jgi:hypothetical protein
MMFGSRNSSLRGSLAIGVLIWLAAAAGSRAAHAQSSPPLRVDIAPCLHIPDDSARLVCFDRLAPSPAVPTPRAASAEPLTREGAETTPEPDTESAEQTAPGGVAAAGIAADIAERPAPREFFSEVAAVREILPGRLEITLTNGQIWRQTNSDRYRLQPGHEVRLYTSRFGRYWRLTATALRGFVQVERVE